MEIVTAVLAAVFCVSGVFLITLSILMPGDAESSRGQNAVPQYGGHGYRLPAGANGNGSNGHDVGNWTHNDHGGYVWQPGYGPAEQPSRPAEQPSHPVEQPSHPAAEPSHPVVDQPVTRPSGQPVDRSEAPTEELPFIDEPLESHLERELG